MIIVKSFPKASKIKYTLIISVLSVIKHFLDKIFNIYIHWFMRYSITLWRYILYFFLILFYFLTLQYCIGFAIYRNESSTGIHVFPILNPPPSSFPYHPSGSSQCTSMFYDNIMYAGFPGSSAGKESTCNAGDPHWIPELGRSPGKGNCYPLQYSDLENSMDCIVHGVAKSWTRLSDFHFH